MNIIYGNAAYNTFGKPTYKMYELEKIVYEHEFSSMYGSFISYFGNISYYTETSLIQSVLQIPKWKVSVFN